MTNASCGFPFFVIEKKSSWQIDLEGAREKKDFCFCDRVWLCLCLSFISLSLSLSSRNRYLLSLSTFLSLSLFRKKWFSSCFFFFLSFVSRQFSPQFLCEGKRKMQLRREKSLQFSRLQFFLPLKKIKIFSYFFAIDFSNNRYRKFV